MKQIKAVLFDMDNTLLDRVGGCHRVYEKMIKELGGLTDPVELEAVVQDCMIWDLNGSEVRSFMAERLNSKYGLAITTEQVMDYWVKNIPQVEYRYPETFEVLDYLKPKYKLALLTNGSSKNQWNKIKTSGFEKYFDAIIVSGDVGLAKPDPRIYQLMLEKLDVKKEEAVYVGDTYSTDIVGAYRAGIKPIWIAPNPYSINSDGIKRIYQLKDLMDIL